MQAKRDTTRFWDTKMTQKRLTSAAVEAMQPRDAFWDTEVRSFGVRCRARDCTYLINTRIAGRQRILTIGRHGRGAWGRKARDIGKAEVALVFEPQHVLRLGACGWLSALVGAFSLRLGDALALPFQH
jgi:hypothetical protein